MRWEFLIRSLKDFLWQGQQTIHLREKKRRKARPWKENWGKGKREAKQQLLGLLFNKSCHMHALPHAPYRANQKTVLCGAQ